MNKVLILSSHHPVLIECIEKSALIPVVYLNRSLDEFDMKLCPDIIGIVTSNAYFITKNEIDLFPNMKFIGRLGSGMEIIDTMYCDMKNIQYWSSPMGNANAVAEHALGMLISINNFMRKSHIELLNSQFLRKENMSYELGSLHVGIIGLGANGLLFAQKLLNLGCQVSAFDIDVEKRQAIHHPCFHFYNSIEPLYNCDVLSLHIPLNGSTHHIVNAALIGSMKNDFILINCARGSLMDTHALYESLKSGKIMGAGVDVWEYEPISTYPDEYSDEMNYILNHPQVIATPHIAGYSYDAVFKMSQIIGDRILCWSKNNF